MDSAMTGLLSRVFLIIQESIMATVNIWSKEHEQKSLNISVQDVRSGISWPLMKDVLPSWLYAFYNYDKTPVLPVATKAAPANQELDMKFKKGWCLHYYYLENYKSSKILNYWPGNTLSMDLENDPGPRKLEYRDKQMSKKKTQNTTILLISLWQNVNAVEFVTDIRKEVLKTKLK